MIPAITKKKVVITRSRWDLRPAHTGVEEFRSSLNLVQVFKAQLQFGIMRNGVRPNLRTQDKSFLDM